MSPAVLIDANFPIYAAGREHPNKEPCARVMLMAAQHPRSFLTDSDVLQELLHRYLASGRWSLGREALYAFAEVMRDRSNLSTLRISTWLRSLQIAMRM